MNNLASRRFTPKIDLEEKYDYDLVMEEPLGFLLDQSPASAVSWIQLLSPVLLAPLGYLTGRVPKLADQGGAPKLN